MAKSNLFYDLYEMKMKRYYSMRVRHRAVSGKELNESEYHISFNSILYLNIWGFAYAHYCR